MVGAKQKFLHRGVSLRRPCGPLAKPYHSPHPKRVPRAICVKTQIRRQQPLGALASRARDAYGNFRLFSGSGTAHCLQCRAWTMRALECLPLTSVSAPVARSIPCAPCCVQLYRVPASRSRAYWSLSKQPCTRVRIVRKTRGCCHRCAFLRFRHTAPDNFGAVVTDDHTIRAC